MSQAPQVALPVRLLDRVARAALVLAMTALLCFTVAQVLDRYLVKSAFNAHDQFARLSLVLLTFLGIAVGIRDRANVRIELIGHLGSPRVQRAVALVIDAVTLGMAVFLVVVSDRMIDIGGSQPILGTPFSYAAMYAFLMAGMGVLALFLALRFANRLSGGRLRLEAPTDLDHDHRA